MVVLVRCGSALAWVGRVTSDDDDDGALGGSGRRWATGGGRRTRGLVARHLVRLVHGASGSKAFEDVMSSRVVARAGRRAGKWYRIWDEVAGEAVAWPSRWQIPFQFLPLCPPIPTHTSTSYGTY